MFGNFFFKFFFKKNVLIFLKKFMHFSCPHKDQKQLGVEQFNMYPRSIQGLGLLPSPRSVVGARGPALNGVFYESCEGRRPENFTYEVYPGVCTFTRVYMRLPEYIYVYPSIQGLGLLPSPRSVVGARGPALNGVVYESCEGRRPENFTYEVYPSVFLFTRVYRGQVYYPPLVVMKAGGSGGGGSPPPRNTISCICFTNKFTFTVSASSNLLSEGVNFVCVHVNVCACAS